MAQAAVEVDETGGSGGGGDADDGDDVDEVGGEEAVESMQINKTKNVELDLVCLIFINQSHSSIVKKFENRSLSLVDLHQRVVLSMIKYDIDAELFDFSVKQTHEKSERTG